ncbi:MAG: sulfotransferase domain-containing protein [Chloroflexota bacterium]
MKRYSFRQSIRSAYDRLPAATRGRLRSILPPQMLRWYALRNTDAYLLSYPKCGRTWLRLMMGRAISRHLALPEDEDILFLRDARKFPPGIPRITVIHDDRPMLKTPGELEASKTKYRGKKIIFLVRDPRDVIVSSYFEMSKRGHIFGDNPYENRKAVFEGSLSDFINQPVGGFDTILAYYNIWARNRHIPKGFLLVRYEDLRADPQAHLRQALDFLGLTAVNEETITEALEFASFENMRKMEAEKKFQSGILNPADQQDGDSYKTRKGKVHGFVDYLSEDEVAALNQKMQEQLSDFFGYTQTV